jgi:peptidoglycan hydrolase-like protein with peptidoglycan-binding domain
MTNPGIKTLQQILNSDPDTRIAATGPGSPSNETDFFGAATLKAVQRFQVKYGIAKSGDSGYGNVGPLTRKILNSLAGKAAAPATAPGVSAPAAPPVPSAGAGPLGAISSRSLKRGVTHSEVKILQQILNSDVDTLIAETGSGSPGNETTFFGPATLKAIKKFQEKYGISGPGDEGYGNVGPKTRAKLNEIGSKAAGPDQKIEDAMKQIKVLQEQLNAQ